MSILESTYKLTERIEGMAGIREAIGKLHNIVDPGFEAAD